MKSSHVGFYVHDHGNGHRQRTLAILRHLQSAATILTSGFAEREWDGPTVRGVVQLESDAHLSADAMARSGEVSGLHYAPLADRRLTRRMSQLANFFATEHPDVVLVDVSVETTLFARLMSIPTVVMRQHGRRDDLPHRLAYEAADRLFAPFPKRMEDDITPKWVQEKTIYADGFCRFDDRVPNRTEARRRLGWPLDEQIVVVMSGLGGVGHTAEKLNAAARATPQWNWFALGHSDSYDNSPSNLTHLGWVERPLQILAAADVVVSAAGHNSVMECGYVQSKLIAIAEPRPFEEQLRKVAILNREGLALGLTEWPSHPEQWPDLLSAASQLNPDRWHGVVTADGSRVLAKALDELANR